MIITADPGTNGGIAILNSDNKTSAYRMPATEGDIIDFFEEHISHVEIAKNNVVFFIEKVGGYVGKRTKKMVTVCPHCRKVVPYEIEEADPGSAMFKFGHGVGFLKGALQTLKIPIEEVTPQAWQKVLCMGTKGGMPKRLWKNKLKAKAQQLYPHIKVTLNTSDALLILYYARLLKKNSMIPALQQGGQQQNYSKKIHEAYEGKPKPFTGQQEMNLGENSLPF